MYAIKLPQVIPAAGQPGGPPLPADMHFFGGGKFDVRKVFSVCIRDPAQLEPTMQRFKEVGEEKRKNH